jgi:F0F1-type ATP synthase epsilon subunit
MANITLKVMATDSVKVDVPVKSVALPAVNGELGILDNRQQVMVRLKKGQLHYEGINGEKHSLSVTGGIAYNNGETVTVLLT